VTDNERAVEIGRLLTQAKTIFDKHESVGTKPNISELVILGALSKKINNLREEASPEFLSLWEGQA
jgi:hypothetical protein